MDQKPDYQGMLGDLRTNFQDINDVLDRVIKDIEKKGEITGKLVTQCRDCTKKLGDPNIKKF